jgi:ferredoxin
MWFVRMVKAAFPARFFVARLSRLPFLGHLIDRWFFDGDGFYYLPKDSVIRINRTLDSPEQVVLPSQVVEYFIEKAGFHWVMDACICRDARQCEDYPIGLGCLFLGEAAKGINPQLGRQVTKEQALDHARRCREAGLVHMIGRHKLDSVWLGVSPRERLMTICNCCPCCCLFRVLPDLSEDIGARIKRMPGVSVVVNEHCAGCGTCTEGICFADAIRLVDGRAVISDACRGCGRCVDVCPQKAIELAIDDPQAMERAIQDLSGRVDVS